MAGRIDATGGTLVRLIVGALLCVLLLFQSAEAQLDETWTVMVGEQVVRVNPDGSFFLPNVAAPDQFGEDGPGSPPDFRSDDLLRLFGFSTAGGHTRYVFSEQFQINNGESYSFENLTFVDEPPLNVADRLISSTEDSELAIGESTQLTVMALLPNGEQFDATSRKSGTVYRASNTNIATVGPDGLVTAHAAGPILITARNGGATGVKLISVLIDTVQTTIEGFVQLDDGSPASGALVTIADEQTNTGADGFFSIAVEVIPGTSVSATASANIAGTQFLGASASMQVVPDGVTDLGIIVLQGQSKGFSPLFAFPRLDSDDDVLAMATADFDGNGTADLAIHGPGGYEINVYPGNGDFSFGPPQTLIINDETPFAIITADWNNDESPDLAATDGLTNKIRVYINNGNGTFAKSVDYTFANARFGPVVSANVNGDEFADMIAWNEDDNMLGFVIFLNNGDGTFGSPVEVLSDAYTQSMAAADVDGDGDDDLLAAIENAGGGGKFDSPRNPQASGGIPFSGVNVYINDGGSFSEPTNYAESLGPPYIAVGDVNGDNAPDLVTAASFREEVHVFNNQGDGTFSSVSTVYDVPLERSGLLGLADINNDQSPDIFVADLFEPLTAILLNNNDGTFAAPVAYPADERTRSLAIADFDGDGNVDISVGNDQTNGVRFYVGVNGGGFATDSAYGEDFDANIDPPAPAGGIERIPIATGDFDADNAIDIAVLMDREINVLFNSGHGGFAGRVEGGDICSSIVMAVGDVNGDGFPDFVADEGCNAGFALILSHGDRTFSAGELFSLNTDDEPLAIDLKDMDGDGALDLVVATTSDIIVAKNDGTGDFSEQNATALPTTPGVAVVGDVTSDGIPDVVAILSNSMLAILTGAGDGSLGEPFSVPNGSNSISAVLADLDGDGDLDLAFTPTFGDEVSVRLGNGSGIFADAVTYSVSTNNNLMSIQTADVNSDNLLDLLVTDFNNNALSVLINQGGAVFGARRSYATNPFPVRTVVADYDNDGDQDVAVAARVDNAIGAVVMLNRLIPQDCNKNGVLDDVERGTGAIADCDRNGIIDACDVDCDSSGVPDVCQIVASELQDCNSNGLADPCEPDCNGNGIPDNCDLQDDLDTDCNRNGLPDACDLASGASVDLDGSGILDECERTLFVDATAKGNDNGTTWENAFVDPNDALAVTDFYGAGSVTQIWVRAGTYKPGISRSQFIELRESVALVGGFAGNENPATFNLANRDFIANETILSGDLNDDDNDQDLEELFYCVGNPNVAFSKGCDVFDFDMDGDVDRDDYESYVGIEDNSIHVLRATGVNETAILDGFTIVGGSSNVGSIGSSNRSGGGMRIGELNQPASPIVRHCRFYNNFALSQGGAIYISENGTNPLISDCAFIFNAAASSGGALGIVRSARPLLRRCTFIRNSGSSLGGGAISFTDSAFVEGHNCAFYGNRSLTDGGAILHYSTTGRFVNCLFSGNRAEINGGATMVNGGSGLYTNCIWTNNYAPNGGGHHVRMLIFTNGSTTFENCILWGNTSDSGGGLIGQVSVSQATFSGRYTDFEGLENPTDGNISADPLFIDADGPDDSAGTIDDNLQLSAGSPCIDAGDNDLVRPDTTDLDADGDVNEATPFDLLGFLRFFDDLATKDTGNGIAPIVDMGPYESNSP